MLLASWATGALARSLAAVLPLGIALEPRPDAMVIALVLVMPAVPAPESVADALVEPSPMVIVPGLIVVGS